MTSQLFGIATSFSNSALAAPESMWLLVWGVALIALSAGLRTASVRSTLDSASKAHKPIETPRAAQA